VVARVNAATLGDAIREQVDRRSTLMTEWLNLYTPVGCEYIGHHRVDHEKKEYVRDGWITTNTVEGFFGQLKRSLNGTYHRLSKEHFASLPR
jgi:ISXO2-like transposase domain